jgi:hypothetical protein
LRAKSTEFHCVVDSAKMAIYLYPGKYCKSPTGHPKGYP